MRKRQTYLVVHIPAWGASGMEVRVTNTKPDPFSVTHGEGNCLVFRLVDGDYSGPFYKALEDGTLINQIGDIWIDAGLDIAKTSKKKEKLKSSK